MSRLYGPQVLKDKILTNISASIREIHRLAVDGGQHASRRITNDDWQVHCLLEHLDFALLFGLRHVQNGYYKCVREFTPKSLLNQIKSLLNLETDIGRGRAWLFLALNDGLTESYLKCFQDNKNLVKRFYTSDAIVSDTQRLMALITLSSGLENIHFDLKADCVYFDRSCWPAYLQVDLKDTEKLLLPGVKSDIPSFSTYISRYDIHHTPSSINSKSSLIKSKRLRVPKQTNQTSEASSVVNSFISSDIHPRTFSRSSSISFDNPSIDGSSLNDENHAINSRTTLIDIPSTIAMPTTTSGLSSSLSELDPMLNGRHRTPSPISSTIVDEHSISKTIDDQPSLTNIVDNTSSISIEDSTKAIDITKVEEEEEEVEKSVTPSLIASSSSPSTIQEKHEDLLTISQADQIELTADANLQLLFTLEIYEIPNREHLIKLYSTNIDHNNGNIETIFVLITTVNIYLVRKVHGINGGNRIEKFDSVRLEQIDFIEVGPNEQFFRIVTSKRNKLRTLTTGCVELTRALCTSIHEASKIGRFAEPKVSPATMQEISIKKELARDMKKTSIYDVQLLDYHYIFWEEPQMSGKTLRKEGYLHVKLAELPTAMKRLGAATLKSSQHSFDTWRHAYVTLRVDRLNIYLHKTDATPKLSYTLLDENCQGCRRNRDADRAHVFEIIFSHDITLVMAAKTKTEQDEWLNAIMKGLSQGNMAIKDEENTANTVPCSLTLTDEKIYLCQDEQDNTLIRLLDSLKVEHVTRVLVDSQCQYYCVLSIEHGNQNVKLWIFYFLFLKEMIQFVKALKDVLTNKYQIQFQIEQVNDTAFQRECERTTKRLLRLYRPIQLNP